MSRASPEKALEKYRQKRDFTKTAEPSGAQKSRAKKAKPAKLAGPLFIVQKHAATRLHFDFRLELDGVLKSWAVTRGPSLDPADKRLAVEVEDHPLEYGGFEGIIPKGQYGGGTVMLWDRGTWEPVGDPHAGIEKGDFKFNLYGERMKGRWVLVRMKPRGKEAFKKNARNNWLLIKERDAEARVGEAPLIENETTSVETERTMDEIAAGGEAVWHSDRPVSENAERLGLDKEGKKTKETKAPAKSNAKLPAFVEPQLATLVEAPPLGNDWVHEIKYDGYRAIAAIAGGNVKIHTRTGLDWTERFGVLPRVLAALPVKSALIDGEIAVADKSGHTDFGALQVSLAERHGAGISYYMFDLLELNGKDLRGEPLVKRKAALEKLLAKVKSPQLIFSDHVAGNGPAVFQHACDLKLEGIISKRADSTYKSARTKNWLKTKCAMGQEFVILGWQESDVRGRPFSSLLMGVYEEEKLRYAGRVGTGFDEKRLDQLGALLKAREIKKPATEIPPEARKYSHYVRADLVAEIEFRGWSTDRLIRQGSFKGLRSDKPARETVQEKRSSVRMIENDKIEKGAEDIEGVRVTHPDDVLFAGEKITKRDLIEHNLAFAELILKHIARRPLSLVRFPDAHAKHGFFQKHASPGFPDAFLTAPIREKEGKADYLYIEETAGLVAAAQVRAVELHIWGSHIDSIENPDRIVFDLDPDEGLDFDAVKTGALDVRDRLKKIGLTSFVMATGGKGLHIVVPIAPNHEWPEVKAFTHSFAAVMAEDDSKRYTTVLSKAKRRGRIFIDYLRNERGSTAVAPYSARARKGGPVAWPLTWSALAKLENAHPVSVADAHKIFKKNPWADYFDVEQDLPLARLLGR